MTGSTERGAPQAGRHIDDSDVAPSAKAESPPLREDRDRVELHVSAGWDDISVRCEAEVGRGLRDAVIFVMVCVVSLLRAGGAAGLGYAVRLPGPLTVVLAVVAFGAVLAIGRRWTSTRKRKRGPGRRPRR